MSDPIGPNVRKLIAERASQLQVEAATAKYGKAGFNEILLLLHADGVGGLQDNLKRAAQWVKDTLKLLCEAPGSQEWPTDELLAGELLRKIAEERKGSNERIETAPR